MPLRNTCLTTTKPVFVVLFLNVILHASSAKPGSCVVPSYRADVASSWLAMRKRNYLKTDFNSRNARNRKILVVAGISLSLYFLATFIFGEMGVIKYYRMQARYNTLTREIATLKQDNDRLVNDVRALKSDPDRLELLARDKLGLARKGEIVYYYGEP
jgi:cell division protein FtsB